MKRLRRFTCALLLAVSLAGGTTAYAQGIPTIYYWGCTYYFFWWATSTTVIQTQNPYDPSSFDGVAGWICNYIAQCSYTQDIYGNVQEYCG